MNNIEIKEPFILQNPYRSFSQYMGENPVSSAAQQNLSATEGKDTLIAWADRVVDWGQALLFQDYEKAVEFVGTSARVLDWGVFAAFGSMQAAVIANEIFHFQFLNGHPFSTLPGIVKVLTIPSAVFSFIMGVIQAFIEVLHLKRAIELLHNVEKQSQDPLERLEWIKKHYFTLDPQETEKIYVFIEKKLPSLNITQKAAYFDRIAAKSLEIKFESLKRRISSGLAEEVKTQLNSIMLDLNASQNETRGKALDRAALLMESITTQAKIRIVVHLIGIIAISLALISLSCVFAGIGTFTLFLVLGTVSSALMLLQFCIHQGYLERGVVYFYDGLHGLKNSMQQQEEASLTFFPSWLKALSDYRS